MYTHDEDVDFASFLKEKAEELNTEQQSDSLHDAVQPKELRKIRVFDTKRMEEIAEENGRSSNLHKTHKRLLHQLSETNGCLPLAELPETIFDDLDGLGKRFPNFLSVIDFLKQEFALSRLTNYPVFTAQPLLILGPPGIGKTAFCHEIARISKQNILIDYDLLNIDCLKDKPAWSRNISILSTLVYWEINNKRNRTFCVSIDQNNQIVIKFLGKTDFNRGVADVFSSYCNRIDEQSGKVLCNQPPLSNLKAI